MEEMPECNERCAEGCVGDVCGEGSKARLSMRRRIQVLLYPSRTKRRVGYQDWPDPPVICDKSKIARSRRESSQILLSYLTLALTSNEPIYAKNERRHLPCEFQDDCHIEPGHLGRRKLANDVVIALLQIVLFDFDEVFWDERGGQKRLTCVVEEQMWCTVARDTVSRWSVKPSAIAL